MTLILLTMFIIFRHVKVKFLNLVPFCDKFSKFKLLRIYMVSSVTVICDSYAFKI